MGEYGAVYRSDDGTWDWVAVGDDDLGDALDGRRASSDWAPLVAIGLLVALALASIPVGFLARRSRRSVPGYVLGTLGGFLALLVLFFGFVLIETVSIKRDPNLVLWVPLQVVTVLFGALMAVLAGWSRPADVPTPPYPPAMVGSTGVGPGGGSQPPPPASTERRD